MSSSQVYPTLPITIDPLQMCSDAAAGIVSNEWTKPIESPISSTNTYGFQYPFNDTYMTPYPSSTVESQPWNTYARATVPEFSPPAYAPHQPQFYQHQPQQYPPQFKDPGRPRSSPSTFGPSAEHLTWPTTNGLGIQYNSTAAQPTPVTSTFPPAMFQTYPMEEQYSTSSPPEILQPQPRKPYMNIAPNPASIVAVKRERDDEDGSASVVSTKRRKRTSSVASADLSEDDRFLVQLKEDESLPWKDIATRFHTDKGKNFQVAALQMRYKRLRERYRQWEAEDLSALRLAHEYWEKYRWEIIGAKMLDFGLQERWPARHCARKWQEIEDQAAMQTATGKTQYSSPAEGPVHFAFIPI
ncbi:hypothetical protein LTR08_002257 [Meristemomyces frigidus]|nr:hypothetical protein LTR08_002257 [Meristemomyces frigidus]